MRFIYRKTKVLRVGLVSDPIDLLRHSSHTTWGSDRTTFLRLYLVLVRSKLDYGAHVYCTASSRALRILDPVQNGGLRLVLFVLLLYLVFM